jgi:hypothetical protein
VPAAGATSAHRFLDGHVQYMKVDGVARSGFAKYLNANPGEVQNPLP